MRRTPNGSIDRVSPNQPNASDLTKPAFYSLKDAAPLVALSTGELRNEIRRGHLDAVHHGRRVLITRESLEQWIADKTDEARSARARDCARAYLRQPMAFPTSKGVGRGRAAFRAALGKRA